MTETKIYKGLQQLASKVGNDFVVAEIYDAWGFDYETKKGIDVQRNTETLELVLQQFDNKKGDYYDMFKVTSTYRDFEKEVLGNTYVPKKYYDEYEDTKNEYMKYFEETHPGVNYDEWAAEQKRLKRERLANQFSRYMTLLEPYSSIAKKMFA